MPKTPSVPARVKHDDAAEAYVEWYTTPEGERVRTKKELAQELQVSRETFYNWEESTWFQQMARHRVMTDLAQKRADVYQSLAEEAKEGSVRAIQLYSELLGDHVQQIDVTSGGESISDEDARQMSTEELAHALIEENVESAQFKKQLEESGMEKDQIAKLLVELLESTPA